MEGRGDLAHTPTTLGNGSHMGFDHKEQKRLLSIRGEPGEARFETSSKVKLERTVLPRFGYSSDRVMWSTSLS